VAVACIPVDATTAATPPTSKAPTTAPTVATDRPSQSATKPAAASEPAPAPVLRECPGTTQIVINLADCAAPSPPPSEPAPSSPPPPAPSSPVDTVAPTQEVSPTA
jgi:hypothetical protein